MAPATRAIAANATTDRLKADFIASLPYAAGRLRLFIFGRFERRTLSPPGSDTKMLSHPPPVRSAAEPVRSRQIEKISAAPFFDRDSFSIRRRCSAIYDTACVLRCPRACNIQAWSRPMRVFVLGGTGSIGAPIVRALVQRGHDVWALARSDLSAAKLGEFGATPIAGDISSPEQWAGKLPLVEAIIHAACDFSPEMGAIDARLLDVLLPTLAAPPTRRRLIYTGGGWLFGATGGDIATEQSPFRPLPAFAWMVPHLRRILRLPISTASSSTRRWSTRPAAACSPASPAMPPKAKRSVWWKARRCAGRWYTAKISRPQRVGAGAGPRGVELYRRSDRRACRRPDRARLREAIRHAISGAAHRLGQHDRERTRRMGEGLCARPPAERRQGPA